MTKEPIYAYDEEAGITTCSVVDKYGRTFTGIAKVAPEDRDMQSQLTGQEIATQRSIIEMIKAYIVDKKVQLETLKHLTTAPTCVNEVPRNPTMIRIYKEMNMVKKDLQEARNVLKEVQCELNEYLNQKDESYKKIRRMRENNGHTSSPTLEMINKLEKHAKELEEAKKGQE